MAKASKGKGSGKTTPKVEVNLELLPTEREDLLATLQERFDSHPQRHTGIEWAAIEERLLAQPDKLTSLYAMETTGGEPDVIGHDPETDSYLFCDCSEQTPDRRSICYDRAGEEEREKKGVFPGGNAVDLAEAMGIELLNEAQYRMLQERGDFDTKTSSWIATPASIRALGGALFGDRRYDHVFIYHNGAQSFYSARGFRGLLRL